MDFISSVGEITTQKENYAKLQTEARKWVEDVDLLKELNNVSDNYYLSRGTLTGNIIRYSDCLLQYHLINEHRKKVGEIKYENPFPPAN